MKCFLPSCQHSIDVHRLHGCTLTGCDCLITPAHIAADHELRERAIAFDAKTPVAQRCYVQVAAIMANQSAAAQKKPATELPLVLEENGVARQVGILELVVDGEVVGRFVTSPTWGDSPCIWVEGVGRGKWRAT